MRRLARFALAVTLLCIPLQVDAQTRGPSNGSLVIVGGAMRDPAIMQRFLDLAGGPDAPIVVIPTAGGGDEYDQFYQGLNAWLLRPNAETTIRPRPTRRSTSSAPEPRRNWASGCFFR